MIKQFTDEYNFLSNFYPQKITYEGITYNNSEAAFQAQKEPERAHEFAKLSPERAKRLGRKVKLSKYWELEKDDTMYAICRIKFLDNDNLLQRLLATGDEKIQEGNTWNDTYWGVNLMTGKGLNKLGLILMRIRDELKYHKK